MGLTYENNTLVQQLAGQYSSALLRDRINIIHIQPPVAAAATF
jgi:hypothetical protein